MIPLLKLALPPKLEPFRKEIEKTCKPYIHINTIMNSPKLYESKFGGNPYLPLEANHPLDSEGKPMLLMAQINFSEVPSYENMPSQGMLQFFICGADNKNTGDVYGLDFDHPTTQKDFRVVFYEDVTTDENKLTTDFTYLEDIDRDMFPIPQEVGLQFEIKIEPVSPTDYRYNAVEPVFLTMKKRKKSTGMSLRASIIKWADTLFSLKAILEHTMFCFFNSPWTMKRILCLVMREWPISSLKKKTFATVTLEMFYTTGTAVKKTPS